jgi:3-dehydroquinate synthase
LSETLQKNIALIGFMAVGKSAIGRSLATKLRRRFVDLDRVIERVEGSKVREIFERKGEAYFRQLEKQALEEVFQAENQVIATGGGVVLDDENLKLLREKALLIGLSAEVDVLLVRAGVGIKRPLLQGGNRRERVEELLRQRAPRYAQAHVMIDTSHLTVDQVVKKIIGILAAEKKHPMESLKVNLGDRSYPIHVGAGILDSIGKRLQESGLAGKVAVVTNPTVAQLYLDAVHGSLQQAGFEVVPILVPDGEEHKTFKSLETIYDRLITERCERKSCVLALGGGVIGDLAGFAAATYLRGVPYVQVPTTLLAQVDSSVGGKTGVNHENGKNLIGAFYQPKVVLIDVNMLASLPRRELVGGLAEVIKYGIIEDPQLFDELEKNVAKLIELDRELLKRVIVTSCSIKARVVEADEREEDQRAVLNFGHTLGHALEAATDYRQLLHGEAVAIGMVKAAMLSVQHGFCDQQTFERILKLVKKAGLPNEIPSGVSMVKVIQSMELDKKAADGRIKFVMSQGIGKTRFHWLSPGEVLAALGT